MNSSDGNVYSLDEGALKVASDFFGTVAASATVFAESPARTVEFTYNSDGMRAKKKVTLVGDKTTTYYTYSGTKLTHLVCGNKSMHFYYDGQGRPAIVQYDDGSTTSNYTYVHTLQGDVLGILDSTGTLVVEYRCDAWGKPISTTGTMATTFGAVNPFRYREYVYDEEAGYYYLRSRYYDPKLRRFICADNINISKFSLLDRSVYTYCSDTPIIMQDSNGKTTHSIGTSATIFCGIGCKKSTTDIVRRLFPRIG